MKCQTTAGVVAVVAGTEEVPDDAGRGGGSGGGGNRGTAIRRGAWWREQRDCQTTPGVVVVVAVAGKEGLPDDAGSLRRVVWVDTGHVPLRAWSVIVAAIGTSSGYIRTEVRSRKISSFARRATATLPTRARRPVPLCATSKPAPLEKYRLDWFCSVFTVLFRSLAVLDTTVGHAMDVLSPFISVLFHGQSC